MGDEARLLSERWQHTRKLTRSMFDVIVPEACSYCPNSSQRSVIEIARHISAAAAAVTRGLQSGSFDWNGAEAEVRDDSPEELIGFTLTVDTQMDAMLAGADTAWLDEVIGRYERRSWIWMTIEHEIHHRGQLAMLLSGAGVTLPKIYG